MPAAGTDVACGGGGEAAHAEVLESEGFRLLDGWRFARVHLARGPCSGGAERCGRGGENTRRRTESGWLEEG